MPTLRETVRKPVAVLALVAGLVGSVIVTSASATAQLVVEPETISVSVPRFETVTETVVLTNAGSEPLAFCLSFEPAPSTP